MLIGHTHTHVQRVEYFEALRCVCKLEKQIHMYTFTYVMYIHTYIPVPHKFIYNVSVVYINNQQCVELLAIVLAQLRSNLRTSRMQICTILLTEVIVLLYTTIHVYIKVVAHKITSYMHICFM